MSRWSTSNECSTAPDVTYDRPDEEHDMGIREFNWDPAPHESDRAYRRRMLEELRWGDPQPRTIGRRIAGDQIEQQGDPVAMCGTHAGLPPGDSPVAVISDVHANLPALEAVLDDIAGHGIERIWCLGDTVGYGASPVECLRLVRDRCELVLAGNHDLAVTGDEPIDFFGMHARPGVAHALREIMAAPDGGELLTWLATRLTEVADARRSAGYSLRHESHLAHHRMDALRRTNIVAAHACPSPFDTVWDYIGHDVDPMELTAALESPPLILVGHAHGQLVDAGVCNPGSVGQPRDGDHRAAWALLPSLEASTCRFLDVELHRTDYDVERAQHAMRAASLPALTIDRLTQGV
jgi:predicted phosphodiesterase